MQNERDPWDAVAVVRGIRIYVVFLTSIYKGYFSDADHTGHAGKRNVGASDAV